MPRSTAVSRPAQSMLQISTIMGLPKVLCDQGLVPSEVLSEGKFDPELFDNPEKLISFTDRGRLIAHCAAATKCEHFGLLVGQQTDLSSLGLLGLMVKYSQDVGTALNDLIRHFHLRGRGSAISLEVHGNTAVLAYQIHQSETQANDQIGTGAVAILYNILHELCGSRWKVLEAKFMQRPPKDAAPFEKLFKVHPHFNSDQNALVFRASWLTKTLPEVDASARAMVQQQIASMAVSHSNSFPEQVRTVLHTAMASGNIKADQVAALFSIHPRTLNRRLLTYGMVYHELVDEVRFGLARQMLRDSDLAVSEMALMLHYSNARSFIRAFRRWSGATPASWRAGHAPGKRLV